MTLFYIAICYFAVLSIVTYFTYAIDKKKAKKGARRIPEKTLLCMSFFGGAAGGFLAMQICRHKTKPEHWYFTVVNLLGIACSVAALILLFVYKPL